MTTQNTLVGARFRVSATAELDQITDLAPGTIVTRLPDDAPQLTAFLGLAKVLGFAEEAAADNPAAYTTEDGNITQVLPAVAVELIKE